MSERIDSSYYKVCAQSCGYFHKPPCVFNRPCDDCGEIVEKHCSAYCICCDGVWRCRTCAKKNYVKYLNRKK